MSFNRQGLLLNAVMISALVAVICGTIRRFLPAWQPLYLVAACFLITIEAGLVHYAFRRDRMWADELMRYLVPEVCVMVVVMRIAVTLSLGTATLGADLRGWLYDPLSIFDPLFVGAIILGLIIGVLTHTAMHNLFELAPQQFEGSDLLVAEHRHLAQRVSEERAAIVRRISSRFASGGVLLLLALSLETVNIERIGAQGGPISRMSAAGALAYLVSGFLLYSQARFALLQSRWRLEGASVAAGVGRRWTRASWALIGGVATAALLLPRAYGMGLLDTLGSLFGILGYAFVLVGYVVVWIISLLALIPAWLLSLFGSTTGPSPATGPIAPPVLPPPPAAIREPQLLPALIFWICMLLLAFYAAAIVLQRHPGLWRAVMTRGPLAWFLQRLGLLWRDTRSWAGQVAQAVQERLRRPPPPPRRGPLLRLSQLAPRELVRYFYRSILQRAAARGLPRRSGQTPYEYGATLTDRLPEAQRDIDELTEAFVVAQYSAKPVGVEEVRRARGPWARVRWRLRALAERPAQLPPIQEPQTGAGNRETEDG
jgi:hypothetical protein